MSPKAPTPHDGPDAPAPRRKGAKARKRPDAPKHKNNLQLSARAHRTLGAAAVMTRRSRGDLASEAIEAHWKRYRISDMEAGGAEDGE